MKKLGIVAILLTLWGGTCGTNTIFSQTTAPNEFGFSAGLLAAGEVYIANFDQFFDLESGISLFGVYDFFTRDKFAVGTNANVAFPSREFLGETLNFYEPAMVLKAKFSPTATASYKPGFNLGYRLITSDDLDTIQGLGLNLTNELQFQVSENFTPFIDLGFITQPDGGNDVFNATFSPLVVLHAGIAFN